jgi:hypothetical protein
MAKRRSRRYRRRSRYAANIKQIEVSSITVSASTNFFDTTVLAINPAQVDTTVSQTYTVKNFEVTLSLEGTADYSQIEGLAAFIMYVPQGMTIDLNYATNHPEYIMNYKYIGTPSSDNTARFSPVRIKTRMARRLQTGDSVILYIKGYNVGTSGGTIEKHGLIRWWTKAN